MTMFLLRSILVYLSVGFLTSPLWGQGHYLAEQPSRTSLVPMVIAFPFGSRLRASFAIMNMPLT
nr:hypothetical protein [uncultured Porphyromonas sp.]